MNSGKGAIMQIEKTTFGPWTDCYRCVMPASGGRAEVELISVAEIGPRIISLRIGVGPNILFADPDGLFKRGDWNIWGGHRIWISPETEMSYHPDNQPCEVKIAGETLRLTAPPEKPSGLQKTLEISECAA